MGIKSRDRAQLTTIILHSHKVRCILDRGLIALLIGTLIIIHHQESKVLSSEEVSFTPASVATTTPAKELLYLRASAFHHRKM